MSNYDANLQPHGNMNTTTQKPGITDKIADKLGMHKGEKVNDHHVVDGTHGANVVGAQHPHGYKLDDPLTHPTGHHTGRGQYDNDPNRIHAHDPTLIHDKDSKPGIVHKIADKLGMHSDKHDHKDKVVQTPMQPHNYQTGVYDNDPNRAQHIQAAQHHQTAHPHGPNSPSMKEKVKDKLGMDKSHDHRRKTDNIDIGGYPVNPTHHNNTTNTHPGYTNVGNTTNVVSHENQHNINKPGFTDKVKDTVGMDKSHGHHHNTTYVDGEGFPVNTTHHNTTTTPTTHTNIHDTTNVVNHENLHHNSKPGIKDKIKDKLGLNKSHDHQKDVSQLPKMTPQTQTVEHDRQGHAISTGYTTTGTSHDLPADSGRTY